MLISRWVALDGARTEFAADADEVVAAHHGP